VFESGRWTLTQESLNHFDVKNPKRDKKLGLRTTTKLGILKRDPKEDYKSIVV
jgi:hypothetical protein